MNSMSRGVPIDFSPEKLRSLCQRYGIRRLSVFGSALRDDFSAESDLDLLVEFQPGRTPGLAFFRLETELAGLFGRRVDLNTKASLSPYFRDRVLYEARDLYVAA
jgi:predicted nucleotidyltransferase